VLAALSEVRSIGTLRSGRTVSVGAASGGWPHNDQLFGLGGAARKGATQTASRRVRVQL